MSAASGAPAPTPILTRSVVLARTGGKVTYERPGSTSFVALAAAPVLVPVGTTVNASAGTVRVTIATVTPGATASALFYTGQFLIAQKVTGIATLTLNGPLAACTPNGATGASGATGATGATKGRLARTAKKRSAPRTRSLWGDGGSGSFTTQGHYAAATVIGTVWLTTDSCTATVVSVAVGHVSVKNLVSNTTATVSGGQALTVQSSGTTATAPFRGPTAPPTYPNSSGPTGASGPSGTGHALTITSNHTSVSLGEDYTLTATGTGAAGATTYIYENVGSRGWPGIESKEADAGHRRAAIVGEQSGRRPSLGGDGHHVRPPAPSCLSARSCRATRLILYPARPLVNPGHCPRRAGTAAGTKCRCGPGRPTIPSVSCPGCPHH